tara:strand:- start:151 stop:543 length:393 start_codon:yes stop_codon:yes gene_type:complete
MTGTLLDELKWLQGPVLSVGCYYGKFLGRRPGITLTLWMTPSGESEGRSWSVYGDGEDEKAALDSIHQQIKGALRFVDSSFGIDLPYNNRLVLRDALEHIERCLLADEIYYDNQPSDAEDAPQHSPEVNR